MRPNVEIVREALEQIVNHKRIDAWDEYFSPDYIAREAPFIGLGFFRDSSGDRHIISAIIPGSPAEGELQVGDELLWVEDERQRWSTYEGISQGIRSYRGSKLKLSVRRGSETIDVELTASLIPGFDTNNDQAKAEMKDFMTRQIPDLRVDVRLTVADDDTVVCLKDYRGTHASYKREASWREIWIARLSEGKIVESWPLPDIDSYRRQMGFQLTPPGK